MVIHIIPNGRGFYPSGRGLNGHLHSVYTRTTAVHSTAMNKHGGSLVASNLPKTILLMKNKKKYISL